MSPVDIADSPRDEEIWAIIDCNTSKHAQDIMSRRINRVSREIHDSWTDAEREKRAPHIARIPWKIPKNVRPAKPEYNPKEPGNG